MGERTITVADESDRGYAPAQRQSLTEQVYQRLKEDILQVRCEPGALLLEPELAARYGVSKTPVREALRLLVKDGWVTVMPRKGYFVRPVRLDDIREVFEVRQMIEPTMARSAAQRHSEADLDRLAEICARQSSSDSEIEPALRAARDFHLEMAALTDNGRALHILVTQLDEIRRLHYLMPKVEHHITSRVELAAHTGILAAVHSRDSERAATLMTEHLTEVAGALVSAFAGTHP
jgi:DNA-binding GntR family transcriptional regulator